MNTVSYNLYNSPRGHKRPAPYTEDEQAARELGALSYTNGQPMTTRTMVFANKSPTKPKQGDSYLCQLPTSASLMYNNEDATYLTFAHGSTMGLEKIAVTPVQMTRVIEKANEYAMLTSETSTDFFRHIDVDPNNQIFVRELLSRQYLTLQKARSLMSLAEAKIKKRETAMQDLRDAYDCLAVQVEELRKASRDAAPTLLASTVDASSPVFAAESTEATASTTAAGTQ